MLVLQWFYGGQFIRYKLVGYPIHEASEVGVIAVDCYRVRS